MNHPHLTSGSKIVNAANPTVRSWTLLESPRIHCPADGLWKARAMFAWGDAAPIEVEMMVRSTTRPV